MPAILTLPWLKDGRREESMGCIWGISGVAIGGGVGSGGGDSWSFNIKFSDEVLLAVGRPFPC
jgi:hypothetical protein